MKRTILAALALLLSFQLFARDSTFYFTTSDQVRLYVRMAGKGKPCVFVHGGPGSTSYYFEATEAAPLIEQQMQMIYFDQRGCGRSDSAMNKDYSLARLEKDMDELRSALCFKRWVVMGHSFGGILITNYAHDYPNSVAGLLLMECTLNIKASMQSHIEFGLQALHITDQAAYRDSSIPLERRVWKIHEQLTNKGIWYELMFRNAYEKNYSDSVTLSIPHFNRDYANAVWGIAEYWKDFTALSAQIRCPAMIMTGMKDYAIGPEHYKSFLFPQQTIVHYIGGHAPFQEEPQWFAEKVTHFMEHIKL